MVLDKQTNKVYISAETYKDHPIITKRLLKALDEECVAWEFLQHTQYSWCRDYMPIQIDDNRFLQYRYYPDYMDNNEYRTRITEPTETLRSIGIEAQKTDIILDGGNVIKCNDCVIMIDKIFKENEHKYTKTALIDNLENFFACEILFLPWDKFETYGHADGLVRYISDDKVLLTNYHDYDKKLADEYINILSRKFNVDVLEYKRKTFLNNWAYINFLQTEYSIFVPVFEKEEDEQALQQIEKAFPTYKGHIKPVKINSIAKEGGAINCITWNIKK